MMVGLALLAVTGTMRAQYVNEGGNKEPFAVEFGRLSSYLALTPAQMDEVFKINEYFGCAQKKSLAKKASGDQELALRQAVFSNLKLMKEALTEEQYRKYVTLLNMTNNNNRIVGATVFPDVYLAENEE